MGSDRRGLQKNHSSSLDPLDDEPACSPPPFSQFHPPELLLQKNQNRKKKKKTCETFSADSAAFRRKNKQKKRPHSHQSSPAVRNKEIKSQICLRYRCVRSCCSQTLWKRRGARTVWTHKRKQKCPTISLCCPNKVKITRGASSSCTKNKLKTLN